ncbi:hypothetical protein THRCLA_01955 [Thraustotheca clavata]|uniref:Uncharacterized protein n=1 Tax=Thraustotheca clavata TaxID=74557 RepID=A0A1W0A6Q2_9STRA|nr:hypothetical protein THRCLA_01955 [Thraustotheca clavata]
MKYASIVAGKLEQFRSALMMAAIDTLVAKDAQSIVEYIVESFVVLEEISKASDEVVVLKEIVSIAMDFSNMHEQFRNIVMVSYVPYKSRPSIQTLVQQQLSKLFSSPFETMESSIIDVIYNIAELSVFITIVKGMAGVPHILLSRLKHPLCAQMIECFHREGPQLTLEILSIAHDMAETGIQSMQAATVRNSISLASYVCNRQFALFSRWFEKHFGSTSNALSPPNTDPNTIENQNNLGIICLRSRCGFQSTKRCIEFMCAVLTDRLEEIKTVEEIELTMRVVKSHVAEYPEFVWNYVSIARSALNQLKLSAIPSLEKAPDATASIETKQEVKDEIQGYIRAFLDTGRISGKLRQRILMQGNVWQTTLKPYLLTGTIDPTLPYAMILGWIQLVHALVHEKAIGEAEYGPFVQKINALVQDRVDYEQTRKRTLASLARELISLNIINKVNANKLLGLMLARVQGQLQQPKEPINLLLNDLQDAFEEWLCVPNYAEGYEHLYTFLKSIKGLTGPRQEEFEKALIKLVYQQARTEALHVGRLLALGNCVFIEMNSVSLLEEKISEVTPDSILPVFKMCTAYTQVVLQLSESKNLTIDKLISVRIVQFLYWVSLRYHFHGLSDVDSASIQELEEKLFDHSQFIVHLECAEFFRVWLEFELHYDEPCTSYRIECLTMHFMGIKEHSDGTAITTICAMGKELLNHQGAYVAESCQESVYTQPLGLPGNKVTVTHPLVTTFDDNSIHSCWSITKKRKRSASSCNLNLGLSLFHQALPMVMHMSKNKISLVNAIVAILTEHAGTHLNRIESKSAYLTLYFELIAVVIPHGPVHSKAHLALQNLAANHLQSVAPWHPRVTSIMLAGSISHSHHNDAPEPLELVERHMEPLVVASVVYFWSMVSTAIVTDTPSLLPPLLEEMHRLLVVRRHEPIPSSWHSLYLKLMAHWLTWGLKLDISVLESKFNLSNEPSSISCLALVSTAYQTWMNATKSSSSNLAYPRLLLQLASRTIELHPFNCGQSLLQISTELPVSALWVLLVTHHLPRLIQYKCMRLHKGAWLHHVCKAYVTYSAASWSLFPALTQR